jgi:hypothetical protein
MPVSAQENKNSFRCYFTLPTAPGG